MILLIILHTIAASIWIGGHLILSLILVPEAWKKRDYLISATSKRDLKRLVFQPYWFR